MARKKSKKRKPAKRKPAKRKPAKRKPAKRKPTKRKKIKSIPIPSLYDRVSVKKGKKTMAKASKKRTTHRKGSTRKKLNVGEMAMSSLSVLGGAIGGAVISNVVPIPDPRIKAAISIALGLFLGSSNLIKGNIGRMVALGMVAGGGLSFARRALPNVPMIAGEDDQLLLGTNYTMGDTDLEGLTDDLEGENEMEGESDLLEGIDEMEGEETDDMSGELELMGGKKEKWLSD